MAKSKSTIVAIIARSLSLENDKPVMWQIQQPVPNAIGFEQTKIMRMFQLEGGGIEVFVLPIPGTQMDEAKEGMILTITSEHVISILAVANFGNGDWQSLLKEAVESEEEEEEEEEEETEVEVQSSTESITNTAIPSVPQSLIPTTTNLPDIPESISKQSGV